MITLDNVHDLFPAPNHGLLSKDPWWQVQSLGRMVAMQMLRVVPPSEALQQSLLELRHAIDIALTALSEPTDAEVRAELAKTLAPYNPTPLAVVKVMLDLADLRSGEWLLDLGCGDGRVVMTAANRGAYAVGIDIDPEYGGKLAVYPQRAKFITGDIFTTDWGTPNVVTCYLTPVAMAQLKTKFQSLRSGTRIVSHAFGIPGWTPTRGQIFNGHELFLWVVP